MIEGWCLPEQISVQRPEAMGLDLRGCHPKAVTYQSRITAMLRSGCPWEADLAGERAEHIAIAGGCVCKGASRPGAEVPVS